MNERPLLAITRDVLNDRMWVILIHHGNVPANYGESCFQLPRLSRAVAGHF